MCSGSFLGNTNCETHKIETYVDTAVQCSTCLSLPHITYFELCCRRL